MESSLCKGGSLCLQIAGQEVEVVGPSRHNLASNGCLLVAGFMSRFKHPDGRDGL